MRATIFLLSLASASFFTAAAVADKPKPSVKIEVEVVVYENGEVRVRSTPKTRYEPMKRSNNKEFLSSDGCCARGGCDGCPESRRNDTQLETTETPMPGTPTKSVTGTSDIVKRIARSVMKLDENNDGRLNADEAQPRLKTPFSDVDSNGDGYLDQGEVMRQIKKRVQAGK